MQRVRATGSTAPARIGGAAHADLLREGTASRKGITLAEIPQFIYAPLYDSRWP